jgi:RNA polymerase sigma-70 factor (ECF subfamily)
MISSGRSGSASSSARIDALPSGLRDVTKLRVLDDLPTGEVCGWLAISAVNLSVRPHRARRHLLI